jgi:hypothetical protein
MVKDLQMMLTMCVLTGALLLTATPVFAADEVEPIWYKTFNGHEMWMTSLDDGLAASTKDGKPMLIDFFSPG